MRAMRLVSLIAVLVLATGWSPSPPVAAPARLLSQAVNAGVFGLTEADWTASGDAQVQDDGSLELQLEDGSFIEVRFDSSGNTTFVAYHLSDSLSIDDAAEFVTSELLPSDYEYRGHYHDIVSSGQPDDAVSVHLYESDDLAAYLPEYSGIVLFAWRNDGSLFSVSIGG